MISDHHPNAKLIWLIKLNSDIYHTQFTENIQNLKCLKKLYKALKKTLVHLHRKPHVKF